MRQELPAGEAALLARWSLDERSGEVVADSVSGAEGQLSPAGAGPILGAPSASEARFDAAATFDGIDDGVGEAYEAWPDRLYLVGRDGRVVFRGGPGPDGFDPDALERAIVEELARIDGR